MATSAAAPTGRITDEAVERIRERIGLEVPGIREGNTEVTRDGIVNFTRGMGDVNPLYSDDEYAANTSWGGLIAHPSYLRYMGEGLHRRGGPSPDRQAPSGDPIAGVHGFFSGVELELFRPLRVGDAFAVRGGLADVSLKPSRMGGQAVHLTYEKVCWDREGQLVGVTRDLHIRIEREAARSRGSHVKADVPKSYTPDEIAEIDAAYAAEYRRGGEPRYWEDVEVGDQSVPMVKGPYTVTSFIVFMAGSGLLRSQFFFTHAAAWQHRQRHPKAFPLNPQGVPDTVACVHWDKEMANRAGVAERYDAGAERIAWMGQALSAWMGDDAFIRRLAVQVRGFLYVGDVLWTTLTVVDKLRREDGHVVRLEISGRNQRDEVVVRGEADVLLPSREGGPIVVPVEPDEAVSIFAEGGPDV